MDTNIWLERLLNQDRANEVAQFLHQMPPERLMMSDFTCHSIGVILTRCPSPETWLRFTQDVLIDGGVALVGLAPNETPRLVAVMAQFRLDFDDAYQYCRCRKIWCRNNQF